ncbi:hypothetical protein CCL10_27970 [Pseudomonas syringae]|nr:hypothetical protein CCL10_27970 [Pseudomonas syringae]
MWIGTEKERFKVQRRIMFVPLLVAILFAAVKVEAYFSGCATLSDLLKVIFVAGLTGGIFYLAGRW